MVRVLTVDQVTPEASSSLYAATRDTVPLSLFDAYWITLPPIQRLFLFPKTSVPFSSITNSLKSSLSKTLTKFPLLAGKLTYLPSTDDVIVDLRQATGVEFIEAESDADVNKLAGDPVHDTEAFISLVPDIDTRSMPMPVMAVMATVFAGGGVAVGVTVHHAVADGKGVWMFMDMWAASCRGEDAVSLPVHDRAVIVREGGEEIARRFVKALAPEIPKMPAHPLPYRAPPPSPTSNLHPLVIRRPIPQRPHPLPIQRLTFSLHVHRHLSPRMGLHRQNHCFCRY